MSQASRTKPRYDCNTVGCDCAEEVKRAHDEAERKKRKAEKRKKAAMEAAAPAAGKAGEAKPEPAAASASAAAATPKAPVPDTPVAFLFPGQGSQAVGMLKVCVCPSFSPECT